MTVLGVGVVARIGAERHQRAFDAGAADLGELVVGDAVAGDHHGLQALVAHLPHDQAAFGVQAAPHHIVGARRLDLRDDGRIILLADVDAFVEHFLLAAGVHEAARRVGEALAVRRLVVQDGDLLVLELAERQVGPQLALLVVAAAGAERVPQLAVGDLRVGGGRGDEQDAVVGVDLARRDRHAGVEVADDELDAVADDICWRPRRPASDRRRRRRARR